MLSIFKVVLVADQASLSITWSQYCRDESLSRVDDITESCPNIISQKYLRTSYLEFAGGKR